MCLIVGITVGLVASKNSVEDMAGKNSYNFGYKNLESLRLEFIKLFLHTNLSGVNSLASLLGPDCICSLNGPWSFQSEFGSSRFLNVLKFSRVFLLYKKVSVDQKT